jgi:anti-sigma regulatory factor (Ser/Thr protein kinase)
MKEKPGPAAWKFSSERAESALESRNDFIAALHLHSTFPVDEFAAKLVYTELVANVVRHASGPIHILLDQDGADRWLHVFDRGAPFNWLPALPKDPYLESGRGLFLVSQYAQEVVIERPLGGGNVVRIKLKRTA